MKQLQSTISKDHQELSPLLPWYVNKSLQELELKAVQGHVNVCLACRRELIQLTKLAQAVKHESALDSVESAAFARLKIRLHGEQPKPETARDSIPQQPTKALSNVKQFKPAAKSWVGTTWFRPGLAMAATVLLSVVLVMPYFQTDYRTLSNGQPEKSITANEIRVVFANDVATLHKNEIVGRFHGQITDSPTAQGVYTVRLQQPVDAKQALAVVESLKKDPNIIFAEPAYALLSSMHVEK